MTTTLQLTLFGTQACHLCEETLYLLAPLAGNDVATLPDFPAEIRAPAGTLAGVSAFQLNFSSSEVFTPGDDLDGLVAMNPAALTVNLGDLKAGAS